MSVAVPKVPPSGLSVAPIQMLVASTCRATKAFSSDVIVTRYPVIANSVWLLACVLLVSQLTAALDTYS